MDFCESWLFLCVRNLVDSVAAPGFGSVEFGDTTHVRRRSGGTPAIMASQVSTTRRPLACDMSVPLRLESECISLLPQALPRQIRVEHLRVFDRWQRGGHGAERVEVLGTSYIAKHMYGFYRT